MGYDTNMEYQIRLQYVVGQIGQKCMKALCLKVAEKNKYVDFRSLLDEDKVKSQIQHLRGINNGAHRMKNILTERQWYSLYKKNTEDKNGCCGFTAREDVENMLDVSLVCELMEHVFSDYIPVEIMNRLYDVLKVKEQIDGMGYMEESKFEELFQTARKSLIEIAKYTGTNLAQEMVNAEHGEIQSLIDENTENYLKLRLLLKDPAERIMRSTMDVSMTKAGFKDREELFGNPFVQSELSRKVLIWSSNRGCKRSQGSFLGQIFDIKGHYKSVKESVVQCLCSFDFDFIYKLMRDLSVLSLELTPYTKEGVMSFIKNLRDIYGQVIRGCPDNKIGSSDFRRYWRTCEEALKTLLRFTGCSNDEEISVILKMNLRMSGLRRGVGSPQIFRVRLEFPPDGLTKYEFSRTRVAEELRKHDQDGMNHYLPHFDKENHDLIFVHHEQQAAKETCECFFDAEATLTKIGPAEMHGADQRSNRNPVVCLVDPTVHQLSGRCVYLGFIRKTTLAEIATADFTKFKFPYLFDAKYCSEAEKRQLYIAMQEVLTKKISAVIASIKEDHEFSHLIGILESHQESIMEEPKGIFNMTNAFKEWLRKQIPSAVQCFSVSSKVKIYCKEDHMERLRSEIIRRKYAKNSDLEFVRMDDSTKFIPLFRPGTRIYLNRFGSDRGGTIALYGKLKSSSKIVAISHGHVIQRGQLAYTDHNTEREELGRAIHPPSDVFQAHPGELSLVEVSNEEVMLFLNEAREQHKKVVIYSGETAALYKKKVAKFGSGTQRTVGFIVETNLETGLLGDSCDGILIEEQNRGAFAKRGDSGALAYIPGRNHITGISLIFADYGQLPDHGNTVITAKLHDCKRNYQINNDEVIEIESDYGLSLMGNTQSSNQ